MHDRSKLIHFKLKRTRVAFCSLASNAFLEPVIRRRCFLLLLPNFMLSKSDSTFDAGANIEERLLSDNVFCRWKCLLGGSGEIWWSAVSCSEQLIFDAFSKCVTLWLLRLPVLKLLESSLKSSFNFYDPASSNLPNFGLAGIIILLNSLMPFRLHNVFACCFSSFVVLLVVTESTTTCKMQTNLK